MQYHYNDNELLYLINEGNDSALKIMYLKYMPLVKKRILELKINYERYQDFFQEGMMMLDKAIKTFNPFYNKTFNKYFDLILQRKFYRLVQEYHEYLNNVSILENLDEFILYEEETEISYLNDFDVDELSEFEYEVLKNFVENNLPAREIGKVLNCNVRKVYNALSRGKRKLKNSIKK